MNTDRAITVGILGNLTKPKFLELLPSVLDQLIARKVNFVIDEKAGAGFSLPASQLLPVQAVPDVATLIFSFGGDGTFLRTARIIGNREIPILGINLGPGLGYLTELGSDELEENFDRILNQDFELEERMLLHAAWAGDPEGITALNDIIIRPQRVARVHSLEVSIDGAPLTTYRGDGLIIATPTGSTAYSLSASGPIIEPTLRSVILTPICPHTLSMRPLVISNRRIIEIKPASESFLIADGEIVVEMPAGGIVKVERAPFTTRIVNLAGRDFYHTLRSKLKWGSAQHHQSDSN